MNKLLLIIFFITYFFQLAISQQVEIPDSVIKSDFNKQLAPYVEFTDQKPSINSLLIYPNPVINDFNIQFNTNIKDEISLIIYNSIGNIVLKDEINSYTGKVDKNLKFEDFLPGIYFIQIKSGKYLITKQIKKI